MAQLDQLIGALIKHKADSLVLTNGERPSLLMDGTLRPVVKGVLEAAHVSRLVAEIAPAEHREAVSSGSPASFLYELAGTTVNVELGDGPRAVIRLGNGNGNGNGRAPAKATAPAPAPAAAPAAATPAVSAVPADSLNMDKLLHILVERGGSDLHICTGSVPMIRVDGEMMMLESVPELDKTVAEKLLLQITPDRSREQFNETGDTDFAYEIEGLCRFRCNLFMDRKGMGGVFRVIPSDIMSADVLGLSDAIRKLCFLTKGLVVVTGPTGSGKSTTLATMIDLVNRSRNDHIITIEDPIEFVHPNRKCLINQREVHLHTQGFKPALRAALREDPDVVLVGEMRDLETVAIAIETAETGHLVFGTLHTSSAVSTVDRIIDQFPADRQTQIRIMLSESLRAVIAQVLLKKIGGGRVAALEVLIVNPAVSNLIREGKTFQIPSIMQTGKGLGMVMLNDALVDLVVKKVVEPQEAYMKALDKQSLVSALRAKNVPLDFLEDRPAKKRTA